MAIRLEFGKHKGKSVKNLLNENEEFYLRWLIEKDFVKEKYPKLYKALLRKKDEIYWNTFDDSEFQLQWYDYQT